MEIPVKSSALCANCNATILVPSSAEECQLKGWACSGCQIIRYELKCVYGTFPAKYCRPCAPLNLLRTGKRYRCIGCIRHAMCLDAICVAANDPHRNAPFVWYKQLRILWAKAMLAVMPEQKMSKDILGVISEYIIGITPEAALTFMAAERSDIRWTGWNRPPLDRHTLTLEQLKLFPKRSRKKYYQRIERTDAPETKEIKEEPPIR